MAVIPVGPALAHREPVDEGLAGRDAAEGQPGHPVHRIGQEDPVPMDRGRLGQAVGHGKRDGVPLALQPGDERAHLLAHPERRHDH